MNISVMPSRSLYFRPRKMMLLLVRIFHASMLATSLQVVTEHMSLRRERGLRSQKQNLVDGMFESPPGRIRVHCKWDGLVQSSRLDLLSSYSCVSFELRLSKVMTENSYEYRNSSHTWYFECRQL